MNPADIVFLLGMKLLNGYVAPKVVSWTILHRFVLVSTESSLVYVLLQRGFFSSGQRMSGKALASTLSRSMGYDLFPSSDHIPHINCMVGLYRT